MIYNYSQNLLNHKVMNNNTTHYTNSSNIKDKSNGFDDIDLTDIDIWSIEDVSKWLKSKSMDKFISVFLEQEIDGNTLLNVPIDSVKEKLLKYDDFTMGSVIKVTDAIVELSTVIEYNTLFCVFVLKREKKYVD